MAQIFISHAREDKTWAKKLSDLLKEGDWTVWWDQEILGGNLWRDTINKELSNAECVLVLWSSNSVNSIWVMDEAQVGAQRKILVPIALGDVDIPLGFRQLQTVRLPMRNWKSGDPRIEAIRRSIAAILKPATLLPAAESREPAPFASREKKALTLEALPFSLKGRKLAFILGIVLGIVYLLNAWMLQSGSKQYSQSLFGQLALNHFNWDGANGTFHATARAIAHSPGTVAFWFIIIAGFTAFVGKGARWLGLLHGGVHLLANLLLAWIFVRVNFALLFGGFNHANADVASLAESIVDSIPQTFLFSVEMLVIGSLVAGCLEMTAAYWESK